MTAVLLGCSPPAPVSVKLPAWRLMPSSLAQEPAAVIAGPSIGSAPAACSLPGGEPGPLLRQDHEFGAVTGGSTDQALGNLEVAIAIGGGVYLDDCGSHSELIDVSIGFSISLPRLILRAAPGAGMKLPPGPAESRLRAVLRLPRSPS